MTLDRAPETLGSVGWIHIVGKRGPTTCGILAISYYPSSQETPFGFYFGVVIGGSAKPNGPPIQRLFRDLILPKLNTPTGLAARCHSGNQPEVALGGG